MTAAERHRELPILYVHDDPQAATVLSYVLGDELAVHSARTMSDALDLVRKHDYALILCDHTVLGVSGVEICARIGELRPNVVRLVTTVYPSRSVSVDAVSAGHIAGHISKPWQHPEFADLVRAKLDLVRMREEITAIRSDPTVARANTLARSVVRDLSEPKDVSQTVRAVAAASGVHVLLELEGALRAAMDALDLAQALALLLEHAAQSAEGAVRVHVSLAASHVFIALASAAGTWAPAACNTVAMAVATHLVRRASGTVAVKSVNGPRDTLLVRVPHEG